MTGLGILAPKFYIIKQKNPGGKTAPEFFIGNFIP
jgi:hypothetical protein